MNRMILFVGVVLFAAACSRAADKTALATPATSSTAQRIGIYDSRAVAVAFAGSVKHEERTAAELAALKEARASGDKAKIAECDKRVWDSRKQLHRQGFGTAPVTDILALYPDEIKALKERRGVTELISKWDEETLKQFAKAEKVDVTGDLIEIPQPNARQRKSAEQIQKSKPLTDAQVERVIKQESRGK